MIVDNFIYLKFSKFLICRNEMLSCNFTPSLSFLHLSHIFYICIFHLFVCTLTVLHLLADVQHSSVLTVMYPND